MPMRPAATIGIHRRPRIRRSKKRESASARAVQRAQDEGVRRSSGALTSSRPPVGPTPGSGSRSGDAAGRARGDRTSERAAGGGCGWRGHASASSSLSLRAARIRADAERGCWRSHRPTARCPGRSAPPRGCVRRRRPEAAAGTCSLQHVRQGSASRADLRRCGTKYRQSDHWAEGSATRAAGPRRPGRARR